MNVLEQLKREEGRPDAVRWGAQELAVWASQRKTCDQVEAPVLLPSAPGGQLSPILGWPPWSRVTLRPPQLASRGRSPTRGEG